MAEQPRRFLLYPVILFAAFFALDKVMLLDVVKKYTQDDATYVYYDYKPELLNQLREFDRLRKLPPADHQGNCISGPGPCSVESGKRILVVLGSSRLLYFNYEKFKHAYPNWEMFNFSAPVSSPAYFDYMLEEVLATGVKPDYVIAESDPFQFNENSPGFVKSNLAYSFDFRYIMENYSLFTADEKSQFLAKNLFAGYRFRPHLDKAWERLQNPNDKFLLAIQNMDAFQRANRGGGMSLIPRPDYYERDYASLAATSAMTARWIYGRYEQSERQWEFQKQLIERARSHDVPVAFLRPGVSRPMQAILDKDEAVVANTVIWKERMKIYLKSEILIDLTDGDPYLCNTFADGSHMSLDCYNPVLRVAMESYPLVKKNMRTGETTRWL